MPSTGQTPRKLSAASTAAQNRCRVSSPASSVNRTPSARVPARARSTTRAGSSARAGRATTSVSCRPATPADSVSREARPRQYPVAGTGGRPWQLETGTRSPSRPRRSDDAVPRVPARLLREYTRIAARRGQSPRVEGGHVFTVVCTPAPAGVHARTARTHFAEDRRRTPIPSPRVIRRARRF